MAKNNKHPENDTIDLPEVGDIPGQENVKPPRLTEYSDTTASSAGEEGDRIFNPQNKDDSDLGIVMGNEADVTPDERSMLGSLDRRRADSEDESLITAELDNKDEDGTLLNERNGDLSGEDLDVPGSEEDDDDEALGEEDEENNEYSLNDDNGDKDSD